MLQNDFHLDPQYFNQHGFCKIERLFTPSFVDYLKELCRSTKNASSFNSFKKNRYNVGITDDRVNELLADERFIALLTELAGRSLVFTDGIIFEIDQHSSGFDWHIGITSFKYIYPEHPAFTLWIPLDPIDPDHQDGGVSLVSKQKFSGREFYKLQHTVTHSVSAKQYSLPPVFLDLMGRKRFTGLRNKFNRFAQAVARRISPHTSSGSLYFSAFSRNLLEHERVSFNYQPGDALLFDKDVFHRSNLLKPGPVPTRRAFVLRFIDIDAVYDEINDRLMGGESSEIIQRIRIRHDEKFDTSSAVCLLRDRTAPRSAASKRDARDPLALE